MKKLYYQIGQRVTKVRHANNLTQFQLAEIMDISVKHCSSVERGESTFSLEKKIQFCDKFGVDLDYLVRGKHSSGKKAPIIPQTVVDIMSSDDENRKKIFLEYLEIFNTMSKKE